MLERSVRRPRPGSAPTGQPTGGCSSRSCAQAEPLFGDLLAPLRPPRHPLLLARFGLSAVCAPRRPLPARASRASAPARCSPAAAAHSMLPLRAPVSAAFGLVLGDERARRRLADRARRLAAARRRARWPLALARRQGRDPAHRSARSTSSTRPARSLLDVTPRQLLALAGGAPARPLPPALERYRYGPGVFKLDWALDGPIPWTAPEAARAGTVHLGGTLERDRRGRADRHGRRAPGAAVRAARAAQPVRPTSARRRASTPPGPTATCRTARRAT